MIVNALWVKTLYEVEFFSCDIYYYSRFTHPGLILLNLTETANITTASSNEQHIPRKQNGDKNQENPNSKYICIHMVHQNLKAKQECYASVNFV